LLIIACTKMGTRDFGWDVYLFAVFPLFLPSTYHKPRLKNISNKVKGGRDISQFYFGGKVCWFYMAPKRKESPRKGDESPTKPRRDEVLSQKLKTMAP
jgi:hypothetical protein